MSLKITGLDDLQREISLMNEAIAALDGDIATINFDPLDQSSVEKAIADMKLAIDQKVGSMARSEMVEGIVDELKHKYEEHILEQAASARINSDEKQQMNGSTIDQGIFRQIENTVSDLRSAEYNTFDRHIKKLSRLLHSDTLEPISSEIIAGVDLDTWLKAGEASQRSMVGSAQLDWPSVPREELGLVILLIDKFAANPDEATQFSHTFYYSGNKLSANLQSMTSQMIVPFARDYIGYVKSKTGTSEATLIPTRTGPAARKVFIVHGHEDGARESVARFLEQLNFEAIILHEQASQGRTIIEKIEAHSDVGFAVILLTPDDFGAVKDGQPQPRARQNVILELGYFVGRLGRSRVCALKRGDLEVPSDFGGVVYEPFDAGGAWKQSLSKELQAAGFDIDWNVAMKR